jgi:uncharacterized protein (TIGR02145 family)
MSPGNQVVRLEYSDGKKLVRNESLTVVVEQGYSAPHPSFKVNPGKGNTLTTFNFDAGLTKDDEDSLDQLKFRWDMWGQGYWTTEFSNNPKTTYQYNSPGLYNPKLEVRDPSGRSSMCSIELIVTMEDSLIVADFSINKTLIRIGDTLILDASASHHLLDPGRTFLYSWYLPDRVEWTVPDAEKIRSLIISQKGPFSIKLKVVDKATKLFSQVSKEFVAGKENLPPKARIQAGSIYGNILTQFYLDAWASSDDNQIPSELEVRWDFDGDGAWDTPFSREKVIYHQYESPGEYHVFLQVRDSERLMSQDEKLIRVSPYTNETSYFKDQRDGSLYGTVKIGKQWWMSQNMNFTIPKKQIEGVYQWLCLNEQSKWCDQVGKLYRVGAVVRSRADDEYMTLCPRGWRLPSREDWETLFSSIGGQQNGKELLAGGKFDFNGLYLGYADYHFLRRPPAGEIYDTVFVFRETFEMARFFSSTYIDDPIRFNNIWMLSVERATGTTSTGFGIAEIYMPVRCLKDE